MAKVKINVNAFGFPMPMSILGAYSGGKANFMALGWFNRVNYQPPMIAAGVGRAHLTCDYIREAGYFSINIPSREMMVETDYVGIISGKQRDKSALFPLFRSEPDNSPLIAACPVNLECKLAQVVDLPSNTLFIGEITGAWGDDSCLKNGSVDLDLSRPFVLSMPDNRYWTLGEPFGKAWASGLPPKS